MRTCKLDNMTLSVDFAAGHITSLILNGVELKFRKYGYGRSGYGYGYGYANDDE